MKILATLPAKGRDLRLDLFRGAANWGIFLDHIPNNVVNWVTTRNYGFSDAADLFIFISGYTVAFVFARIMLERGFIIGASRLLKRVWQIYVAHVFLFVAYLAEIGYLAQRYGDSSFTDEFNIRGFLANPAQFLFEGLILRFKPVNMDVLPLYIVLMGVFPPILWLMLRRPNITLAASALLYLMARHFGWNVPAYPIGVWYFNPFAWQFLFTFGAWFALGGSAQAMPFIRSRTALVLGTAYLLFALMMTMAARFDELRTLIPPEIYGAFNPNDKTNLASYRLLHFVVFAFFVVRLLPRNWPGLEWRIFRPAIKCGQQSLEVFCTGIFLSFAAHFVLVEISGAIWMQIAVSIVGILTMTALAYYRSWSKNAEKAPPANCAPRKLSGSERAGEIDLRLVKHRYHGLSPIAQLAGSSGCANSQIFCGCRKRAFGSSTNSRLVLPEFPPSFHDRPEIIERAAIRIKSAHKWAGENCPGHQPAANTAVGRRGASGDAVGLATV